jgi:hypothetical protein
VQVDLPVKACFVKQPFESLVLVQMQLQIKAQIGHLSFEYALSLLLCKGGLTVTQLQTRRISTNAYSIGTNIDDAVLLADGLLLYSCHSLSATEKIECCLEEDISKGRGE